MSSQKRKIKRRSNKLPQKNVKVKEPYYKYFMLCCIILLVGIFLPERFGIHYLEFSFLYLIVLPICFVAGLYFKYIKNLRKGTLYMALWAVFCTTFTLYGIANLIYANAQQETYSFTSEIESVAASGYRSPSSISFKLNSREVAIVIKNEYPIKDKLDKGQKVIISRQYKKGFLSSVMIVNYKID